MSRILFSYANILYLIAVLASFSPATAIAQNVRIFLNDSTASLNSPIYYAPTFPAVNQGGTMTMSVWVEPSQNTTPQGSLANMSLSLSASNDNLLLSSFNVLNTPFLSNPSVQRWVPGSITTGAQNQWNNKFYYFAHQFTQMDMGICPIHMLSGDDQDVTGNFARYSDITLQAQPGKWGTTTFCLEVGDGPMYDKQGNVIQELYLGESNAQPAVFGSKSVLSGNVFVRGPAVDIQVGHSNPVLLWNTWCPGWPVPPTAGTDITTLDVVEVPLIEYGGMYIGGTAGDQPSSFFDIYIEVHGNVIDIKDELGPSATCEFDVPPSFPSANLLIRNTAFSQHADFLSLDFDLAGQGEIAAYAIAASSTIPGDVNGDGAVNLLDVGPFISALGNGTYVAAADVNGDGEVNLLDVDPFIEEVAGDRTLVSDSGDMATILRGHVHFVGSIVATIVPIVI